MTPTPPTVAAPRLRPLFLIKPKSMSARDIRRVEKQCGIIIVECETPDGTRLLERPIEGDLDAQARAAISLMRYIVDNTPNFTTTFSGAMLIKWFTDKLLADTRPSAVPRVQSVKK